MAPSQPKCPLDGPKIAPRLPKIAPRTAKMAPRTAKMAPRTAKMAPTRPRWPQDQPKIAARWPQDGPRWPQDGPKMGPRWPKMAPRAKDGHNPYDNILFASPSCHFCNTSHAKSPFLINLSEHGNGKRAQDEEWQHMSKIISKMSNTINC